MQIVCKSFYRVSRGCGYWRVDIGGTEDEANHSERKAVEKVPPNRGDNIARRVLVVVAKEELFQACAWSNLGEQASRRRPAAQIDNLQYRKTA